LKDLAGELNIPVITAAQINREGANKSKLTDDLVADSDRILRYCSTLMALSRKSNEEIERDGLDYGTHRLQVLNSRSNASFFEGINYKANMACITFEEAVQSPELDLRLRGM